MLMFLKKILFLHTDNVKRIVFASFYARYSLKIVVNVNVNVNVVYSGHALSFEMASLQACH